MKSNQSGDRLKIRKWIINNKKNDKWKNIEFWLVFAITGSNFKSFFHILLKDTMDQVDITSSVERKLDSIKVIKFFNWENSILYEVYVFIFVEALLLIQHVNVSHSCKIPIEDNKFQGHKYSTNKTDCVQIRS